MPTPPPITDKQAKIIADAMAAFQEAMKEARERFEKDLRAILKKAIKEAEHLSREKEGGELKGLEEEMEKF